MCEHHHHENEQELDKGIREMLNRRRMIQALAAGGAVAVSSTALQGCATNAETGDSQFLLIGEGQLSQMAAQSWAEAKRKQPVSTDPRYTRRLAGVGKRIARASRRDNRPWDYAVFDSDTKNAFVLPGNHVGFYRGIMDFSDNDDQIAAVMGHEVGHVVGKHAAARMSQQLAGKLAVMGGTVLAGSQISKSCRRYQDRRQQAYCYQKAQRQTRLINQALGVGFMVGIALPFSRKHESQADLLGVRYMHRAGYNPYQAVKLWEKMGAASTRRQPEFLSTHPAPERRARDLYNYIKCQERLGSQGWSDATLKASLQACKA